MLTPIHSSTNRIRFYVWSPSNIELSSSTTVLSRVEGWEDSSCNGINRFQTARLSATAEFSSGNDNRFVANVLPLIVNNVSIVIY